MKKTIHTDQAPAAIGTYSQAVQAGNLVFLSGQVPLNPVTMELVEGDFEASAHQVFKNLKAVARAGGGDMGDMVKLTVYLTDMSKFPRINDVMAQYFTEPYPARAAVAVRELPKGAEVEIDAIMMLPT
ncbi:MAG: RidA family protein [Chromatiales bacterium]|nr:RidA family protein [Chromatiales bacterium]